MRDAMTCQEHDFARLIPDASQSLTAQHSGANALPRAAPAVAFDVVVDVKGREGWSYLLLNGLVGIG